MNLLKKKLPSAFTEMITYISHSYSTRSKNKKQFKLPKARTTKYGINSITY